MDKTMTYFNPLYSDKNCFKCGAVMKRSKHKYSDDEWLKAKACSRECLKVDRPVARMRKLYEEGHSTCQIAKLFGIGRTTVKRIFRENNIQIRPPGEMRVFRHTPLL